ncbi:MAG: hypothetical protein PHV68_04760, partial [Candidatus Gastranaerophilales bacterium]|nr:hypothetical protein [Candidatus Gastranaerophilales bacterium]
MRIRGVKAELEEAGLETEGMAESTAKLRAQVKALTNIDGKGGIDILADEDTFKSTYAIILEISKVWKNISDIDQAALLELLSGKRQGNIIAAALTNMTDGVNAYEASLNSLGSAEAEHEKWMESIEAKQKKFQAQYQVFSTAFLNSDLVGAVYDIGTGLLSILTPLAKINALLPLIAASMALIHYYNLAKQASEGAAAAASLVARLIAEKTVTDGMVVTYQTLNAQQKLNIVNKLEEAVATGALTAAEYADIRAKLGLAAATTGAKVATDGLNVSIKSLLMSNPVGWIITAISLLPMLINLFGSLHKSNDELIQDAEDLKSAYSSDSSKVTEDVATLEGLKDEYEELSKGVDDYGNNISLAADDYERYQDIVSTILGISPSLISGYDNEGQAIANKNGLLQQSIDLMKEEQRLKMQELVSDDSLKTIGTGAVAQIEEYEKANPLPYGDAKWDFIWAFQDAAERYANSVQGNYEGQIYDALNPDNIDLDDFWTEGYWNEYGEHAENFASDYYETIVEALRSNSSVLSNYFTEEEIDNMLKIADSYDENLKLYNSKIANLSKALNPTLQYVPQTLTAYNELSDAEKQFLTGYINTFTITADTTEKDIIKMKQDILDFTDFIANNETLREQIQIGVNLQLGKDKNGKVLSVKEYREQISQFLNNIGSFDAQTQGILKAVFGIDENGAYESDIEKAIEHAKNLLADEYDGLVDDLSVEDVMQIYYSISADPNSLSYEELMAMLHEVQEKSARAVKSYETLRSATNAAVMAQSVQRDTFADNTYITEDAYNALVELAGGETQLSGCIDTANGYFVTNAKLLSDVIDASNEALVSNIKLAESHEKSNYHSLVKELASVCNGLEDYDEANLDVIESIFDQIDATKLQIAKFALLEQQVLGVTNAFEALDKAQELDEASDYTDELSGMISSLFTSYENNEFGTESFWTAFEALVPEDIYSQFTDAGDQIEAGWDYINGKLARYYTSDGSSLSIGFENIKSFVSDGLSTAFGDSTVFTGSLEDFKLNDQITSVEELADAMGVTTTTAFALANAISKYSADNEDFLSSLSVDSLEGKIYDVDQKLADLLEKQTELGKNGDIGTDEWNELQSEISSAKAELVELQDAARENVHANIEIDSEIEAQQKVVDGLHDDLMELDETDPSYSVTMKNYTEASDELSQLLAKKYGLEEPTEMTIQVALESVQSDIDSVTSQLSEIAEYDAEADVWVAINESDQTKVDELMLKLQTLNDEYSTIEVYAGIDDEDVLSSLEAIQDYVIDDKEFTVSMDGYGTTKQRLETVTRLLNGIKSKTVYVTTYTKTAAQNYAGTANASGSWGTKEDEKNSLVGELGTELLVNPKTGMYETVGEHGAEIVDIPKGSIIFNHKQTEQLLKYRRINNRGKAYLNGNAHFSLVDKVYSKPGSDDSNSNNTSTVVVDATDLEESLKDTLDKLSEEFDKIIGNFEHSIFMMEKNG